MLGKSRISSSPQQGLKQIAKERWNDVLLFDAIKHRSYTYREFFAAALYSGQAMQKISTTRDETICLVVHNSVETLALIMGALLSNRRVALIDPLRGPEEIETILSQIERKKILYDDPEAAQKNNLLTTSIVTKLIWNSTVSQSEFIKACTHIVEDDIFLATFTSGTTGLPKGVMHSFRNLYLSARSFGERFGFNADDTFYHHLPMTYMAGILNSFLLPLIHGSKIVIGPRFSISQVAHFWDVPIAKDVTVFWFVPTMLALLTSFNRNTAIRAALASRKVLGCVGTAPLGDKVRKEFESIFGVPLYESYGLSETLFISTQSPRDSDDPGSVGKIVKGAEVNIAKDSELVLEADWMYKGYIQNGKEELFHGKTFKSGDLGEIDTRGNLHITGRKKDIIIRGGVNISPRRIEEFCHSHNYFKECVILGFSDPIIGEKIVCYYVAASRGSSKIAHSKIVSSIRSKLGAEYAIDEFCELKRIPVNTNGKIDKLSLRALYQRP